MDLKPLKKSEQTDLTLTYLEMESTGRVIPAVTLRFIDPKSKVDIDQFMLTDHVRLSHNSVLEGQTTLTLSTHTKQHGLPNEGLLMSLRQEFSSPGILEFFSELVKARYYVLAIITAKQEARVFVDYHTGEAVGWKMQERVLH